MPTRGRGRFRAQMPKSSFTGVSRYFEQVRNQPLYAVEPARSPVIPDTLDLSVVDRVEQVTDEESIETARRLSREDGILSGISCGAATAVAASACEAGRARRQDHRGLAARLRRTVSVDCAVRGDPTGLVTRHAEARMRRRVPRLEPAS